MQLAIVAADYTPGEADQLRRSMAAWKRKGGLGPHKERLITRMTAKGYALEYAERIFKQIEGFGEYGFPESHAASFALLAYVSCWIKRHHPDAFLAGLLEQPADGFLCARATGAGRAPARSRSACSRRDDQSGRIDARAACRCSSLTIRQAVRLGLNRISGLREDSIKRIVEARIEREFDNVEDLAMRAQLNSFELEALAASGALATLAGHRHQAGWEALGVETRRTQMLKPARFPEPRIELAPPTEGADIVADYERLGLTLGRHPLALLRPRSGENENENLDRAANNAERAHRARVRHRHAPAAAADTRKARCS